MINTDEPDDDWGPPGEVESATAADIERAPLALGSDKARALKLARLLDRADENTSGVAAIARQHELAIAAIKPYMAQPIADPVDELQRAREARRAGGSA